MVDAWRLAKALEVFRAEVNARWPGRDKRSDGTIGDAEHATRSSDHNPWLKAAGVGVVRAVDIDKDLTGPVTDPRPAGQAVEAAWLAGHLRDLGRAGDPRLVGGGYVIWNKRIASEVQGWAWRPYAGANTHEHHVHLSVTRNPNAFDSTIAWGIAPTVTQEDDVLKDQTITNPVSGKPETIDVTVAYMEQRIVGAVLERVRDELPDLLAAALLKTVAGTALTVRNGQTSTEAVTVAQALTRGAEASVVRQRDEQPKTAGV